MTPFGVMIGWSMCELLPPSLSPGNCMAMAERSAIPQNNEWVDTPSNVSHRALTRAKTCRALKTTGAAKMAYMAIMGTGTRLLSPFSTTILGPTLDRKLDFRALLGF